MPEPVTIGALAVAGLSWVFADASGAAGGVIGAVAASRLIAIGGAVRDRIAGWRGLPENEHLARAVRRAQMHALERALRDWRETLLPQWQALPPAEKRFCNAAIGFCATTLGRCADLSVKLNAEVTGPLAATLNGLLAESPPGSPSQNRAIALAGFAEDTVLAELRDTLPGIAIPPAFERHFRQGDGQGRASFLGLFGHFIASEIKEDEPFRAILTQGQLATIAALGFDATEMLHRIEQRFGDALREISQDLGQIRTEQQRRDQLDAERHAALMAEMAREKGVEPEKLLPIFEHLGHQGLSPTEIRARAEEAIAAILDRASRPAAPTNDGADIAATIDAARAKLGRLDSAGALASLADKMAQEEAARRQRLAPLLRETAAIQRLTYDHAAAKATLRQVTDLDPDAVWDWIDLGDLHETTGALADARTAFDAALAAATRQDPGGRDVAAAQDRIGSVQVAQGDLAAALASFGASHDIFARLAAADPGNAGWQRDLSVSHDRIGDVQVEQGDLAAALASFGASHDIAARLAEADPGNAGWQRDLSVSHEKIGDVQLEQGDLAAALARFDAGLAIAARLAEADPGNAGWQRDLSVSHNKIGDVQVAQGDLDAALASFGASLSIRARLAAADPGNAGWQRDLSVSHDRIGDVQVGQGDLAAALASFGASHDIFARLAEADPGNAGWQRDLSVSHERIAGIHAERGETDEAIAAYGASLALYQAALRRNPGDVQARLASVVPLAMRGRLRGPEGRADLAAALAILRPLAAANRLDHRRRGWIAAIEADLAR